MHQCQNYDPYGEAGKDICLDQEQKGIGERQRDTRYVGGPPGAGCAGCEQIHTLDLRQDCKEHLDADDRAILKSFCKEIAASFFVWITKSLGQFNYLPFKHKDHNVLKNIKNSKTTPMSLW